jgi:thiol-disulfide isomerase/thioredoxin
MVEYNSVEKHQHHPRIALNGQSKGRFMFPEKIGMKKVIAVSERALVLLFLGLPAMCISAAGLEHYPTEFPTPALNLEDLSGQRHTLDDYRGQVLLINFWATWCPPCLIEMPSMQRLLDKLAGRPFRILAVNVKESAGTIWKFHKLIKANFPLLLDRNGQVSEDWRVVVYPSSYLVDTHGQIRYEAIGMLKWDEPEVVKTIEELLGTSIPGTEAAASRRD